MTFLLGIALTFFGPGGGIPSPIGQSVQARPYGITGTDPRPCCDWNGAHCHCPAKGTTF